MRNILLGITGSVAATLARKLALRLSQIGQVRIIFTKWGGWFVSAEDKKLLSDNGIFCYRDNDEWPEYFDYLEGEVRQVRTWRKTDPVLHIDLRRWASCLVIAPLSANTLAKMANGLCDNLLTSVYRAWDHNRPVIVAPAMNTMMWENEPTHTHLDTIRRWNGNVVGPIAKDLACGDSGMGAMANIEDIAHAVEERLRWHFPLEIGKCKGIPLNHHPGAFGFSRHHNHHTGVDLYTEDGALVHAVEDGTVVVINQFTGPKVGHEWWEDTWGMMVEGASGVVNYGEISPACFVQVGHKVKRGQYLGNVKRVLFPHKLRPDIPGHSCSMLHMELYKHGARDFAGWEDPSKNPELLDPTPYLMNATGSPHNTLTWDNSEGITVG